MVNVSARSESTGTDGDDRRIRIVHVVKGLGPGGAERLIVNQLHDRDENRFEYRVVRLVTEKDHLVPEIESLGVDHCSIGSGPTWPAALAAELRRQRPDVVHVHSPLVASVVRTIAALGIIGARVVTTEHNRWPRHHRLTRVLNRATNRLDDATIAVSEDVRRSMSDGGRRRAVVLRHGIVRSALADLGPGREAMRTELGVDGVVVGIVANFRPEKGYDVFLDAVVQAVAASADLRFVVVGQGPGEQWFRESVHERGLGERVVITGYRPDATAVMTAFDVFTLSSIHEGLPVALMEAMALGLPVVATNAGGIGEAVTDGREGRVVPVGDADALATAWLEVAADPELRARMAQAALLTSGSFDSADSTREIESTYRTVLGRAG